MPLTFPFPTLLGHRGAPREEPENTLASFKRALDAGLDGLELDLQKTADGVLAVHHDADLHRRPLVEMSWKEVRRENSSTARLEEVLELLQEYPSAKLNLELKSPFVKDDGRERVLAELLKNWQGEPERAWISSFDPLALIRLRRLGVALPLALLVSLDEALELLPCLPVDGVHVKHSLVTTVRVRAWKQAGLFVFAWTVNDLALAASLLRHGIDGLMGDEPEVMLAARREVGE